MAEGFEAVEEHLHSEADFQQLVGWLEQRVVVISEPPGPQDVEEEPPVTRQGKPSSGAPGAHPGAQCPEDRGAIGEAIRRAPSERIQEHGCCWLLRLGSNI